jgi:hypothetical protein
MPSNVFMGHLSYDIQFHGFIDSYWVESGADKRRSASWIYFSLSFATISWASRKQKFVALSTSKAEYISACDACTKVVWLRKMVYGLFDQVLDLTMIDCDNQSYVNILENLMFHDKSKHIEIKYYFLYDQVQRGELVLQYISTDDQIADILVNPLSKMKSLHT